MFKTKYKSLYKDIDKENIAERTIMALIEFYIFRLSVMTNLKNSVLFICLGSSICSIIVLYLLKLMLKISDSVFYGSIYIWVGIIIITFVIFVIFLVQTNKLQRVVKLALKDIISYYIKTKNKDKKIPIEIVEATKKYGAEKWARKNNRCFITQ